MPESTLRNGNHHVSPEFAGLTLAAFLRSRADRSSWGDVNRLIEKRFVSVDGNLCTDPSRRLRGDEVVKVLDHAATPPARPDTLDLVYHDTQVVVVDKPAGVTTLRHPSERSWSVRRKQIQPTLDELLAQRLATPDRPHPSHRGPFKGPRRRAGKVPVRPGRPAWVQPVHRLDRDTSGLMLFARTPAAQADLSAQFKNHAVERLYRAVVVGDPGTRTIRSTLVRDRGDGIRGSIRDGADPADFPDARTAVTHVRVVETVGPYTLVECRLETGRTHQIRIHLAEAGHPLCGEKIYTRLPDGTTFRDESKAPRHALHAAVVGFEHPSDGRRLRFESDWPSGVQSWLAGLR